MDENKLLFLDLSQRKSDEIIRIIQRSDCIVFFYNSLYIERQIKESLIVTNYYRWMAKCSHLVFIECDCGYLVNSKYFDDIKLNKNLWKDIYCQSILNGYPAILNEYIINRI